MKRITDSEAKSAVRYNISRILAELGQNRYWLMQQAGMTEGSFYGIANGKHVPSLANSSRIADALGVKVDELLTAPPPEKKIRKKNLQVSGIGT